VPDFAMNKEGLRKLATSASCPCSCARHYTVKLVAAGVERSETLTVRKDPNTAGTDDDVRNADDDDDPASATR